MPKISMFMSAVIKRHHRQKDHRGATLSRLILDSAIKQYWQMLPK
jgi:hypothetical protein